MKGIIIYKGKYGATSQYANWLSEELDLPVIPVSAASTEQIAKCNFLIIGSSVYMGKMLIKDWLRKNISLLANKKIWFFIVSATAPGEKLKIEKYYFDSVPAEIRSNAVYFPLLGKMLLEKLSRYDRFMLKMGARLAKDPEEKEKMLLEFDLVKKENIKEILKAVKRHMGIKKELVVPVLT